MQVSCFAEEKMMCESIVENMTSSDPLEFRMAGAVPSDFEGYREINDMVRVVHMYFRMRMRQPRIAEVLHIPQTRVSRLLQRAEDEGIIRFEFNLPVLNELSALLAERFSLRDTIVIPSVPPELLKNVLGRM